MIPIEVFTAPGKSEGTGFVVMPDLIHALTTRLVDLDELDLRILGDRVRCELHIREVRGESQS